MSTYQVVLFDLDGTLLDTSPGIKESVAFTLEALGLEAVDEATIEKRFIGPPLFQSLAAQFPGLSQEEVWRGVDIFRDYYPRHALFKAHPYDGILDLLAQLKQRHIRIGVATYKPEHYAVTILRHFGIAPYCQVLHGADLEGKLTKADIVALCLKELGASREQSVLVGDTEFDAQGAQAQGVGFVGVRWGFGYKEASSLPHSPYVAMVENTEELLGILTR